MLTGVRRTRARLARAFRGGVLSYGFLPGSRLGDGWPDGHGPGVGSSRLPSAKEPTQHRHGQPPISLLLEGSHLHVEIFQASSLE